VSLELAHKHLGWPSPAEILNPPGAGPNALTGLARKKIGQTLSRLDGREVKVGILLASPRSDATESPLAVVCEFAKKTTSATLAEAHKLAWNFSATPLLFTVEPALIRSWTCCEPPQKETDVSPSPELREASFDLDRQPESALADAANSSINWLNLLHGSLIRNEPTRFRRDKCADQLLLENLRELRRKLTEDHHLDIDTSHDLLARLIFIQFLFQRKDSQGRAALNEEVLASLFEQNILRTKARTLDAILSNRAETYRLFKWLNLRFNGDLFPSDEVTDPGGQSTLAREMALVKPEHLQLLSDFVGGRLELKTGQLSLWQQYSFDAIPLEFISSIYESFLSVDHRKKGAVYTPAHIVDFVLDSVLPWSSSDWNVRVLDPACGSGIFLVKAFQRLVYRWRNANPGFEPKADLLRRLLERNIVGVDIEPHAVRTAVFSLYLALCDEIDPKQYWKTVRFPKLRGERLIADDFFSEKADNALAEIDALKFDLVVGNAPWGKNTVSQAGKEWAAKNQWPIPYGQIGPLFLPKCASLCATEGRVAMLQPASLIFGTNENFVTFRHKLFSSTEVEELTNLSALRFGLFSHAISPACVIILKPGGPTSRPIQYLCPKPDRTADDNYRIKIEPGDVHTVDPEEAQTDPLVWYVLRWGGRRDLAFVRQLLALTSLAKLANQEVLQTRDGIIRGDRTKKVKQIVGRRLMAAEQFPPQVILRMDGSTLPINNDPSVDGKASTDFTAFGSPQLVIKKTRQEQVGRFRAVLVEVESVICSHSYVSVRGPRRILDEAAIVYNSLLAVYFLFLTSSRLGTYRPEVLTSELLKVPLPNSGARVKTRVRNFDEVDSQVRQLFDFKEAEWALVEDRLRYTFPDFASGLSSPGRKATDRGENDLELTRFCDYFLSVLQSSLGDRTGYTATIFTERPGDQKLAVRMVAIHLTSSSSERIRSHSMNATDFYQRLRELSAQVGRANDSAVYQRVFRLYDLVEVAGQMVPTVFLVRPDQARFWTRVEALREGDDTVADLITWNGKLPSFSGNGGKM
jgi:hypothetical protein